MSTGDYSDERTAPAGKPSGIAFVAPWGNRPTPLLPRWYRDTLSGLRLPDGIEIRGRSTATVGDIGAYWETGKSPIDGAALRALIELVGSYRPPPDYVIVPAEPARAKLAFIPLRSRTMNALRKANILEGSEPLTVGQVLSLRHFGIVSLLDLMCVVEQALTAPGSPLITVSTATAASEDPVRRTDDWESLVGLLTVLLNTAAEFHQAVTVRDALGIDLAHLASTIGIAPALGSIAIKELTDGYSIAEAVCERLTAVLSSRSSMEFLILRRRILGSHPATLAEVGREQGVSRERVRQVQRRLEETLDEAVGPEIEIARVLLAERLGPVVSVAEFEGVIDGLFDDESMEDEALVVARWMLRSALNYSCAAGTCFDQTAVTVVGELRDTAKSLADDAGLIDDRALREHLPGEEWNRFFPQLLEHCGFHRIGHRFALRDTVKARVKGALLGVGRPATRDEIAAAIGLDARQVGAQLSMIPSVVRSDKTHWGLAHWVEDVYEGIPAEIIQRIDEDGGATSLDRLLDELPRRFGVSESSVRTYVGTPQFTLRNGYVSLADESSISLRDLDDVIDGRDASGDPYWILSVEDRYFAGYSLVGFPPELARELGCEPNGSTQASVDYPPGCREVSVIWRLASATGASLGYLADPLRRLGVSGGDRIRLVIKGIGVVELRRDGSGDAPVDNSGPAAQSILDRMKHRRQVL